MNDYTVEVKYMVNGCGKKIPATRTVVVRHNDQIVYEERTQENIEIILETIKKKVTAPPMSEK